MTNLRNANKSFVQDDLLNIKEYLHRFLSKWFWFVFCAVAGVGLSYLLFLYQQPVYQVESTILVNKDNKSNTLANMFEESWYGTGSLIDNQIGIIKSFTLNREVMQRLNWRVSWYRVGIFTDKGLYKADPFMVSETPEEQNLSGVQIRMKVLSSVSYLLTVDKKLSLSGREQVVELSQEGRFGEPFSSRWFHFTIGNKEKMIPEVGAEYLFNFNDIKKLVTTYRNNLEIKLLTENSEILSLKVKGPEPARDIDYLNELSKSYIAYGLNEKNKSSESTIRFIDLQLSGISDSLHRSAQRFSDFRSSNKVMDLSQEGSLVVSKLAELETQRSLVDMRLKYFKNLRNYIGNAEQMKQVVAPSIVGITDPIFNSLVSTLIELYRKREILSYSVNDLSPNLEILDKEIRMTRKSLDENLKNILINAESELKQYTDRINKASEQMASLPAMEQQMISIKGRFEMNNEMNNFLLKKKAEAAITMASNAPDAHTLDAAFPETMRQMGPNRSQFMTVGLLLGLLLPMLIILIYDFFNDTIRSIEQLERRTNLPIIGSITHNTYPGNYPVMEHPRAAIAESFRGLRSNLQFLLPEPEKNVISIHSTVPNEGKTFISLNLATIMALNNKKVVLVGCDLRKPRLQKIMDQKDSIGLSNYLIGSVTFDEIVQETKIKGLFFIPAGHIPPNPAELLENSLFEKFIKEVREKFDLVILDNAPISIITDSVNVGSKSDANVFILRQEYSHKDQIKFINAIAQKDNLHNVVLVLNDVAAKGYGYGGKRYGNYNYNYQYSGGYYSDSTRKKFFIRLFSKRKYN